MLILFAEDEPDLAELTIDFLATEDIECDYAFDGEIALNLLRENNYDVIVLDITMPRLDGLSVCKKIKEAGITTPIIFLTARDALEDKLAGFDLGAEDYLTKPFELEELTARIKVLAKRKQPQSDNFSCDTLTVNFQQRKATRAGRLLSLSQTQWQLLRLLMINSPNIVSRVAIEDELWPNQDPSKDVLKTLVFRLRNIIDNENDLPLLHTVRGAGIVLTNDK